jgi:hypothetical protein
MYLYTNIGTKYLYIFNIIEDKYQCVHGGMELKLGLEDALKERDKRDMKRGNYNNHSRRPD